MQYRKNKSGEDISLLGYGCMRFTRKGGGIDLDKAEKEIRLALEGGVNYFDTAYIYPGSEAALGEIFRRIGCREKIQIATKLPHYLIKSADSCEKYFREQLSRLRTDYVDYYLMHMLTDVKTWERLKALGILEWLEEKKKSGIHLSVLGVGTGNIKDNKMETLADKGNGNYAYIDSMREAKKVLEKEMTATLLTICKDVKLQVEFNPAVVAEYRLIGYENRVLDRKDFEDDTKDAGEIGAGHSVTAMYELTLKDPLTPLSEKEIENLKYGDHYKEELEASDGAGKASEEEWLTISIRYKKPAEDTSSLLQYPVSFDSYTYEPGEDFQFAAAVAEFGLLASHSEYPEGASVEHVLSVLEEMNLEDEYKAEFEELVQEVR